MSIEHIAHLSFKTHNAYIGRNSKGTLYCFKYTNSRCDLNIFDCEIAASDYILEPLPNIEFVVNVVE